MAHGMKYRIAAVILAGVGFAVGGVAAQAPSGSHEQPEGQAAAVLERTLSVFALKHTSVREFSATTGSVIRDPHSLISFDERTNSIILLATADVTARVRELVDKLDVEIQPQDIEEVRVYSLEHAVANIALIDALTTVLSERGGAVLRLSTDTATNQLIARGSGPTLERVDAVLLAIDRPAQHERGSAEISVRLIWLTSQAAGKIPPDMGDVTDALAEIGVTNLGMAAQTIIRATDRSHFKSEFTAGEIDPWAVRLIGQAKALDDGDWSLDISISARQVLAGGETIPGSLGFETRLTTEAGHFVVLGVAPIKDVDSVFVIQIVEAD